MAFTAVEVVAAFATGSLALLSDAGHMGTDALGLAMALAAVVAAGRPAARHRTFGLYRLEILAALANALLLFGVAGYVVYESIRRLAEPTAPPSAAMLVVAALGLAMNLGVWLLLRGHAGESLNVEGAMLEVLADLVGSIAVIVAGVLILITGWEWVDPVFALAIGVFVLPRAWRLGGRALRVLIQAAPEGMDLDEVRERLSGIHGVVDVHDLHVWTLTADMTVASVHLVIAEKADPHPVLDDAHVLLESEYRISHATLQVEPETHRICTEMTW